MSGLVDKALTARVEMLSERRDALSRAIAQASDIPGIPVVVAETAKSVHLLLELALMDAEGQRDAHRAGRRRG